MNRHNLTTAFSAVKMLKRVSGAVLITTSLIHSGLATERDSLGKFWGNHAPKFSDVINMHDIEKTQNDAEKIRVGIVDGGYINTQQCDIAQSCVVPEGQAQNSSRHATNVGRIEQIVCPNSKLHTFDGMGTTRGNDVWIDAIKKATTSEVDIVNMSLGYTSADAQFEFDRGTDFSKAFEQLIDSGKIVVLAYGNEKKKLSEVEHEIFCDLLKAFADRPEMKERVVLAVNSDHSSPYDTLNPTSSHPYASSQYALTAPGTSLALKKIASERHEYEVGSGTSYSAPVISGVLAQLLFDLRDERKELVEQNILEDAEFKRIVVEKLLGCARKTNYSNEYKLSSEFGVGVVNYFNTKKALMSHFRNLISATKQLTDAEREELIMNEFQKEQEAAWLEQERLAQEQAQEEAIQNEFRRVQEEAWREQKQEENIEKQLQEIASLDEGIADLNRQLSSLDPSQENVFLEIVMKLSELDNKKTQIENKLAGLLK